MSLANSIVSDIDALDRFADQLILAGHGYADQTSELWRNCSLAAEAMIQARACMLAALEKALLASEFPNASKVRFSENTTSDDFMPHIEQAGLHIAACVPPDYDFIIMSIKEDFDARMARIKSLRETPEKCVAPLIAQSDLMLSWCMNHIWGDR